MIYREIPTLRTKLLKKLRAKAHNVLGVFRFSDEKYYIVFDRLVCRESLSEFDEDDWKSQGCDYSYQVLDEAYDTLQEAITDCDYYRRGFILNEVRKMRTGSYKRYY